MAKPVCIGDFEELAKKVLPQYAYDFCASGAEEEFTLKENCQAYNKKEKEKLSISNTTWYIKVSKLAAVSNLSKLHFTSPFAHSVLVQTVVAFEMLRTTQELHARVSPLFLQNIFFFERYLRGL